MQHQPRVLVVDDDENILSAFKDFLKKERCEMIAAVSADEAMAELGRQQMDLLIADVRLKGTSGVTFLIDARQKYPTLPAIVITGYPDLVSEQDAKILGAEHLLLKPLDLVKLRKTVRKCLRLDTEAHANSHKEFRS